MHDKQEVCNKIRTIYPELGECGIDVTVQFNEEKNCWIVDLRKDRHQLITHLEPKDADACVEGKECVHLGAQISQLIQNIKKA